MKSFSEDKTAPEKYKHDFGCKEIERKKIVEQAYPVGYVGAFEENPNEDEETIAFVTVYSRLGKTEDGSWDTEIERTYWEAL